MNLKLLTDPFPTSFPAGNHKLALYVCGCISVLYTSSFNLFSDRALCINSLNAHPSQEAGTTATPISQMRKLRHQEVNYFAQSHTVAKQRSWDLNASSLDLDFLQYFQEMLGISNSVTNFKFCRIPHSNPVGNPHPSSTLTGSFICHLLGAKCSTVLIANGHKHLVSILQTGKTDILNTFYSNYSPSWNLSSYQVQQVCKDTWPGMFR